MDIMKKIARVTVKGKIKGQEDGNTWCEVTFLNPETGKPLTKIMSPKKAYSFVRTWRNIYPLGGKHIKKSERTENRLHIMESI